MGKIVIILRVSPVEQSDLPEIEEAVKKVPGFNSAKVEDFVFGTKILKVSIIYEDGSNRDIQSEVAILPKVANVEFVEESLL